MGATRMVSSYKEKPSGSVSHKMQNHISNAQRTNENRQKTWYGLMVTLHRLLWCKTGVLLLNQARIETFRFQSERGESKPRLAVIYRKAYKASCSTVSYTPMNRKIEPNGKPHLMEVPPGIEPGSQVYKTHASPAMLQNHSFKTNWHLVMVTLHATSD